MLFRSRLSDCIPITEAGRATVMGMQSLKRIGQPDDVASVVEFLASDASRWITGDVIAVDGGSKL